MPRATKKDNNMENKYTSLSKRISTMADKIASLENDLSMTQKLIREDMKKIIDLVRENRNASL
jgi:predicted  nucleic acid-binding Zn-ribbon protein|tara:strand:- start:2805 stop:2993 length:189 start_codon:yes stop_codon:yes gene_type:complete